MFAESSERERLSHALQLAMHEARQERVAVPVREIARRLIAETGSDPALYPDVLDALCALCVRSGLTIEFTRPLPGEQL
ncbi:MAG TPA: hypothetical protein VHB74_07780 [Devosia sp.]|nr:hypothetical protein [Devosia sp.]